MIYLDNAATTWPKPEEVYKAVDQCLRSGGNPGRGGHGRARAATYILYEARETLAQLLNVENPTNIAFAYNATDALNTAILGLFQPGQHVVTTSMEHNAVARPLRYLESKGVKLTVLPCDMNGKLELSQLQNCLEKGATAVVMGHASNVTGNIMPIAAIGEMAKEYKALFIVDSAQTAGVEDIDVVRMNIDVLAFSGHKGLFGPQGTGGLYVREGIALNPLRYGGTGSLSESDLQPDFMPDRLESGTPNTPGIAGLLAGAKFILHTGRENIRSKELALTEMLIRELNKLASVKLYGATGGSRTAVVSFNINEMDSGEAAHYLDSQFNIACRAGLHCAPWAHKTLGTIKTGTIRFSPGYFNTVEEIEQAIDAVRVIGEGRK